MPLHRITSRRNKAFFALGLACAGTLPALDAHARLVCEGGGYKARVISAWNQNPNWDAAVGSPIASAQVEIKYMVRKELNDGTESVATRINWSGNRSAWSEEAKAMKFVEAPGDAKGFGLQILAVSDGNRYATPSTPGRGAIVTFPSPTGYYEPVYVRFNFTLTKITEETTSGHFGLFGDSFHWGLDKVTGTTWSAVNDPSCGFVGGGGLMSFDMLGIGLDGIGTPKTPTVTCTINNGMDVSYPLEPVSTLAMEQIGVLPTGYTKQEHSISYQCTGTATTDPAFSMALIGPKAGTTNALQSTNPHVGVMVEAVDGVSGTSKVMIPDIVDTAAQKVRIYNAGAAGGSSLTIRAYPVRSQAGTIDAGNFTATGTLKIFIM